MIIVKILYDMKFLIKCLCYFIIFYFFDLVLFEFIIEFFLIKFCKFEIDELIIRYFRIGKLVFFKVFKEDFFVFYLLLII